jgi:hypothetical protein
MTKPRIFYHCYDSQRPSGGQKDTYQHVDVLNRHGFDACVLHHTRGFRLTWFDNDTRVAYAGDVHRDPTHDIIVLPEDLGLRIGQVPGLKVIFNKGMYRGFASLGPSSHGARIYLDPSVLAVFCVSEHNRRYLQFAYPHVPIECVRYDIRAHRFPFTPLRDKLRCIAYDHKAEAQMLSLLQLLHGRTASGVNRLHDTQWICLNGLSEAHLASALQRALIFVTLSTEEGHPRLPLEAMACGCLVCGYACGPLSYLPEPYRFACGDLMAMALRIEEAIAAHAGGIDTYQRWADTGRAVAERYSSEAQERSVLEAWNRILERQLSPAQLASARDVR